MTQPDDNSDELSQRHTKSFLEHLEDLRKTLLHSAIALGVGVAVSIPLAPWVVRCLKVPLAKAGKDPDTFLQILEVTGGLTLAMQTILWTGVLLASPFIFFFIGQFVFPGLTKKERHVILSYVGVAVALFFGGVALAYFLALSPGLQVMLWFNDWMGVPVPFWRATDYIRFVILLLLSFGIAFELPVILLVLGQLGIVTSGQLRHQRRLAVVVILILAAVVTPTTDAFSMLLIAGPMTILYEICIWIIWSKEQKAEKARG